MFDTQEFERLQLLFRRGNCLPALPATAFSLIETIDRGDASASELERIISKDPLLAAAFLKCAALEDLSRSDDTSIRYLIMRLGQNSVRNLALSLVVRRVLRDNKRGSSFDSDRYSRHSLAVGLLGRYVLARQVKLGREIKTSWGADGLFSIGVLHDLTFPLLAHVAPESYERIHWMANRRRLTLAQAFKATYGQPHGPLGATAIQAWALPSSFADAMRYMACPWSFREESEALCALAYADELANKLGFSQESWHVDRFEEVTDDDMSVPDQEIECLKTLLFDHVAAYIAA